MLSPSERHWCRTQPPHLHDHGLPILRCAARERPQAQHEEEQNNVEQQLGGLLHAQVVAEARHPALARSATRALRAAWRAVIALAALAAHAVPGLLTAESGGGETVEHWCCEARVPYATFLKQSGRLCAR